MSSNHSSDHRFFLVSLPNSAEVPPGGGGVGEPAIDVGARDLAEGRAGEAVHGSVECDGQT